MRRPQSSRWRRITNPKYIPSGSCGVYAIFRKSGLWYIGQSTCLRSRLKQHGVRIGLDDQLRMLITQRKGWYTDSTEVVTVRVRYVYRAGDWLRREYCLLRRLRPPGNAACPQRLEDKLYKWASNPRRKTFVTPIDRSEKRKHPAISSGLGKDILWNVDERQA